MRLEKTHLAVFAASAIFFIIVLLNISRESLWGDEMFSVLTIGGQSPNLEHFWHLIFNDNHPFLYNLLLYFYAKIAGVSDSVLRFFSAIWIMVGAIISYALLFKHGFKLLACVYCCIFILAPNTIYYAQELRNYGMLLGISSVFCVIYFLLREKIHSRLNLSCENAYFIAMALLGSALVLTHYYAYLFCFVCGISLLFESCMARDVKSAKKIIATFLIIGIVGIIWLALHCVLGDFQRRIIESGSGGSWIYEGEFYNLVFSVILSALEKFGYVACIFAFIWIFITNRTNIYKFIKTHISLSFPIILEICLLVAIFCFFTRTMEQRFFMEIYPFFYLLIALMLTNARFTKTLSLMVCSCLVLHSALLSATYKKPNLRGASEFIAQNFSPQNCKLPTSWEAFAHYLNEFEIVKHPIIQDSCDLIFFRQFNKGEKDYSILLEHLNRYGIYENYCVRDFGKALVVLKNCD